MSILKLFVRTNRYVILFPVLLFSATVNAEYTYQNSNGQLKIEYTDIANSKTLQTIKKNGTLIAQHCYQNGKRIKDGTPECGTATGGGTDGGNGSGGSGSNTGTPYTIEYEIEGDNRVRLSWSGLANDIIYILPEGQTTQEDGAPYAETDGSATGKLGITVNGATPGQNYQAVFYLEGNVVGKTDGFEIKAGVNGTTSGNTGGGDGSTGGGTDGGDSGNGGTDGGGTDGGTDGNGNTGSGGTTTANLPPAIDYPNWSTNPPQQLSQPAMASSVTDPGTGYKVWRLGGSNSEMHNALPYPDGEGALTPQHKQHFYSRIVATNKDETYIFGSGGHKGGYAAMWRMSDKRLVKWVPTGKKNNVDGSLDHFAVRGLYWDQNYSNVYWYTDANKLLRATIDFDNNYTVSSEVWDTFSGFDYITMGSGEGEFSDDGSKLVLVGHTRSNTATPETIIAYEVSSKRRAGTRTVPNYQDTGLNWAGVDPTGQYIVFDLPENLGTEGGIWTWVVPWNNINAEPRLVYTHKKHSDFVIDKNGIPWLAFGNYQGVFAARLDQTHIKRVWPVSDTSPSDNPGHSAYASEPWENGNGHMSRVANLPGTLLLGRNEHAGFYYVNIDDPGKTRHVGNARNGGVGEHGETVGDGRYLREPRASATNSGRYIFFVTDYLYDGSVYNPDSDGPYENRSYLNMIDLGGYADGGTSGGGAIDTGGGSGGGTDSGGTGSGGSGGTDSGSGGTSSYTIDFSVETRTDGSERVQLAWSNLSNDLIAILPDGQTTVEEGTPWMETGGAADDKGGITVHGATPGQLYRAVFYLNGVVVGMTDAFEVKGGVSGTTNGTGGGTDSGGTDSGGSGGTDSGSGGTSSYTIDYSVETRTDGSERVQLAWSNLSNDLIAILPDGQTTVEEGAPAMETSGAADDKGGITVHGATQGQLYRAVFYLNGAVVGMTDAFEVKGGVSGTTNGSGSGGTDGGGSGSGGNGGTDNGNDGTSSYTIDYSVETREDGTERVQLAWSNLSNDLIAILPDGQTTVEEGAPAMETGGAANDKGGITVRGATPGQLYRAVFYLNGAVVGMTDAFEVKGGVSGTTNASGSGGTDGGDTGGGSTGNGGVDSLNSDKIQITLDDKIRVQWNDFSEAVGFIGIVPLGQSDWSEGMDGAEINPAATGGKLGIRAVASTVAGQSYRAFLYNADRSKRLGVSEAFVVVEGGNIGGGTDGGGTDGGSTNNGGVDSLNSDKIQITLDDKIRVQWSNFPEAVGFIGIVPLDQSDWSEGMDGAEITAATEGKLGIRPSASNVPGQQYRAFFYSPDRSRRVGVSDPFMVIQ